MSGCTNLCKLEIRGSPFGDAALLSGLEKYESWYVMNLAGKSPVSCVTAGVCSEVCTYRLEQLKIHMTIQRGVYDYLLDALFKVAKKGRTGGGDHVVYLLKGSSMDGGVVFNPTESGVPDCALMSELVVREDLFDKRYFDSLITWERLRSTLDQNLEELKYFIKIAKAGDISVQSGWISSGRLLNVESNGCLFFILFFLPSHFFVASSYLKN